MPSVASRPPTLSALSPRRTRSSSTAASMSPSVSCRAFLQSIMPAPVRSRSSLTCAAVMRSRLGPRPSSSWSSSSSCGRAPSWASPRRLGLLGRRLPRLLGRRRRLGRAAPRPRRSSAAGRSSRPRLLGRGRLGRWAPRRSGSARRLGLGRRLLGRPARASAAAAASAAGVAGSSAACAAAAASAAAGARGLRRRGGGGLGHRRCRRVAQRGLGLGALGGAPRPPRAAFSSASRRARSSASRRACSSASCARLLLLGAEDGAALGDHVADRLRDQRAGADRVVVARDDVVDAVRVAVGVDQADDRDPQALRLADGDHLGLEVDHEHRVGHALHVLDAAQVGLELLEVGLGGQALARRQQRELAVGLRSARGRAGA